MDLTVGRELVNVLHVIGKPVTGGLERIVSYYGINGLDYGLNCDIFSISTERNISIYGHNIQYFFNCRYLLIFFKSLFKFDIIHAHTFKGLLIFKAFFFFSNVNFCYHLHSYAQIQGYRLFFLRLIRFFFNIKIISASEHLYFNAVKVLSNKQVFLLENFIPNFRISEKIIFDSLNGRALSIGFVGRFEREKEVIRLTLLVDKIREKYLVESIKLYGSGSLFNSVYKLLKDSNKDLNLYHSDSMINKSDIYSFDILMVPSTVESFSLVTYEALSMGVRVVVDAPEVYNSLQHYFSGLVCNSSSLNFVDDFIEVFPKRISLFRNLTFERHAKKLLEIYAS